MARFTELPLDLLDSILGCLSKKEFHALLRASKFFYKHAQPHLYKDVRFKARQHRDGARKLERFLRTLLEQPRLSTTVKAFRLHGAHPFWAHQQPPPSAEPSSYNLWGLETCTLLSKAQRILASNQFYQLIDGEMRTSREQFRGRSKDALSILILIRLTELTTLDLSDGFLTYSLFIPQILKRAPCLLPKLDHVILGDRKSRVENALSYMDLDLVRPIFYLPNIRTFEWKMSEPWTWSWNRDARPRADTLTRLDLFRGTVHRNTLQEMLAATPSLKLLRLELQSHLTQDRRPRLGNLLNLEQLNTALECVKGTLEDFSISLGLSSGSAPPSSFLQDGVTFDPILGTLSVLKSMPELKNIRAPLILLLGWFADFAPQFEEVIPRSIQTLTLTDDFFICCPWTIGGSCQKKIDIITEFVRRKTLHAPNLVSIEMVIHQSHRVGWLEDAVLELEKLARAAAVNFRIVRPPYSLQYE